MAQAVSGGGAEHDLVTSSTPVKQLCLWAGSGAVRGQASESPPLDSVWNRLAAFREFWG